MSGDLEAIGALLERGDRFVLTTHVGPDGDGFGAELALGRHLLARGKQARVLNPDRHPACFDFLLRGTDSVDVFREEEHGAWVRQADAVVLLDVNSLARLGEMAPAVGAATGPVVCMDHHRAGTDEFPLSFIREEACATGQLIYEVIEGLGFEVSEDLAEPLYVSILTDTGSFRYSRTSPRVHRMAARLLELGVRPQHVFERIYENLTLPAVLLTGDILSTMRSDCGGRLTWAVLTRDMLRRRGAAPEDASDVVNYTIAVEGVEVGVLFRELGPARTKASLRSRGRLDVHRFARGLGGGGHQHAAGIVLEQPFEEGCRTVLVALRHALAELG